MKVLMLPHPSRISGNLANGIDQVIIAYAKYLPDFGIELVDPKAESFDLIAAHAGLTGPQVDICHLHGVHWSADYDAPEWEYHVNAAIVEAVRHAKVITVPSEWVAETIRRDLRVNPAIIPHGIDWQAWQGDEPRGDYVLWNKNRKDVWICDPTPVYQLAKEFTKMHFVSTFQPDKSEKLTKLSVTGLIPHAEMKKLVQGALVYLATAKETFGIGILEAMASGVPVLGYAHGGILDLVQHGVNGYLAEPGDMDDLAEGLRYCVQHRATLGDNGREMARAWTWQRAVGMVAEVYRRAAEPEPATVGVVIPCYNKSEQELRRAVESVIRQTYPANQIIVIDDGSKDTGISETVVRSYGENGKHVSLWKQTNSGVANARNRGIELVGGVKYISCLDGDDWMEPDFLRVCVAALEADNSLGIAYCGLKYHKPDGETGISPWPGAWDFDAQLQRRNQVPTCCVFRREMWARLGGYRQRYAPKGCGSEDAEFWTRAGAYGWKAALVEPHASILPEYHKATQQLKRPPTDEEMERAYSEKWQLTRSSLFNYSWMSGLVTGDPDYHEPDWLGWHPWVKDNQHPFASYAKPKRHSHPVRAYDKPAVSVVIPVGPGHEREVVNALDSLEAQTFRKWEVIVVWDSHDDIPDWLQVAYPYVRFFDTGSYFRQWTQKADGSKDKLILEKRIGGGLLGAGYARNHGAEIARAPFLLFLDADDWLYPEALHKMVTAWNAHQAIVYTDYVGKAKVDDPARLAHDLQQRLYSYDERRQEAVIGYRAADFDCERALQQPELPQPFIWCNVTALIPKVWHDEIGGFDENMESWEDVDYHWRHARAGHCYYHLQEELMVYRFYTGSRRDKGLQNHKNLVQYITEQYAKDGDIVGCRSCPGGGNSRPSRPAPMSAAGGPVGAAFRAGTPVRNANIGPDTDFVKVKYVKPLMGVHSVIGSAAINPTTDRRFNYGEHKFGDIFLVHADDVYMVDRHSGNRVLRDPNRFQPVEDQVVKPPAQPKQTPPPVAIVVPAAPAAIDLEAAAQVAFVEATRGATLEELVTTGFEPEETLPTFNPQTLPGVTKAIAAALEQRGLDSREAILAAGVEGLVDVPGIGERRAQKIVEYLKRG